METKEEVCQFIISEVRKYLDKGKPSVRYASLTRKTGCSRSTIQRAAQGEISTMRADTVFSMLRLFRGIEKALVIMETLYPKWHKIYGQYWRQAHIASLKSDNIEWNEIRSHLLDLSGTTGVSTDWILNRYGSKGIEEAEYLVFNNVIELRNGKYFTLDPSYSDSSASALERAIIDAKKFDHDQVGNGQFWQRFTESFTDSNKEKFLQLTRTYVTEIRHLISENSESTEKKNTLMVLNFFGRLEQISEEDSE